LIAISNHYKFDIDLNDFEKIYHMWYSKNTILQSQKNIEKYTKQQSTKLDILQQAYVDAQKE
jgi:hypothetical protein